MQSNYFIVPCLITVSAPGGFSLGFSLILLNKFSRLHYFIEDIFAANYSIGTLLQNFSSNVGFMVK